MKNLYWRPRGISRNVLTLIALVSLLGLLSVEFLRTRERLPYYEEKVEAAQLAAQGFEVIRWARLQSGHVIDPELDPADSGLIGFAMTPVTTVTGVLPAKQTSVNPNFAAVIVEMLKEAGVKEGDVIAVGASGSFPALNICVLAAARTLNLQPIIISSVSASQFGANDPNYLWIDMERILNEWNKDLFPYRSVAASYGGVNDKALGMSKDGRAALDAAIERNGLKDQLIKPKDQFEESIERRMEIYQKVAGERKIRAYINIGGGTVSVGSTLGKKDFHPGLNMRKELGKEYVDSVMSRFIDQGAPIIHLTKIQSLAEKYNLPQQPLSVPAPGEGLMLYREEYNTWLATAVLIIVVACLYAFVRSDVGYRLFQTRSRAKGDMQHGPMV